MNSHSIGRPLYSLVPALAMFLLFQACGGSDDAAAADSTDIIEGVWETTVTARDCTTGAAAGVFKGSQVYHRGGTMTETNAQPPATRGPGFGTWTRSGDAYTVKFRFYTYDPATNTVTGSRRVVRTLALSADGAAGTTTATTLSDIYDMAGTKTGTTCATDTSVRIY